MDINQIVEDSSKYEKGSVHDLVVRNALVLPMTDNETWFRGSVAVDGGEITSILPDAEGIRLDAKKVIDANGMALLPGFVNTHFHFTQNFLKGSRDDLDLLDWIDQVSFPRIKHIVSQYRKGDYGYHHHSVMHAGIDLIRSGITTTINMEWATPVEILKSYKKLGIKVINGLTLTDNCDWTPKEAVLSWEQYFDLSKALIEGCKGDEQLSFAYAVACPNSNTKEMLQRTRQEAYDNKAKVHIHLAETKYEFDKYMELYGKSPTQFLEDMNFWDSDVWAAHSIWLTDEDIKILHSHDVGIAHNPKCNMKIADGAAPIAKMLDLGMDVGLGIDSCAVSDNTDFFEAMRAFVFLQRVTTLDPKIVLGRDALAMATRLGARAMNMGDRIGTLEEGKDADMILVNLRDVNIRPLNNIFNNIVFAANSHNIKTVIARGNILMEDGVITCLDEEKELAEAEEFVYKALRDNGMELPDYFTNN
ncbi:amidohydrolase family protein [Clostridia bacterium]|nr:amidohydrolase family protein [Clostridia bacterium]